MSAWIVTREHIDVLVTALKPENQRQGDSIGRMLWRECLHSVAYRYPDDGNGERPGPTDFRDSDVDTYVWTNRPVPAAWVYAASACYGYQSCEHPQWKNSEAYRLTEMLALVNERHKRETDYSRPHAANNPPWGIDSYNLAELAASTTATTAR